MEKHVETAPKRVCLGALKSVFPEKQEAKAGTIIQPLLALAFGKLPECLLCLRPDVLTWPPLTTSPADPQREYEFTVSALMCSADNDLLRRPQASIT